MSISKHDQKLILVLLGLAIFLASYFGISKAYNEKRLDVESQTAALSAQLDTLRSYNAQQSTYQSEIDTIDQSLSTKLALFPSDIRSEDLIMFVTELEAQVGISVSNISLAAPQLITKLTIPEKSDSGYQFVPKLALRTGLTVSCSMSYAQMKKLVTYIYANKVKTDIESISVSYNSASGELSGSVTIARYFICPTDYVYDATDIPFVQKGVDNPFGTITAGPSGQTEETQTN